MPGTHSDTDAGWEYYGKKFNELYKNLNQCVRLPERQYRGIYIIIVGLHTFVRSFEGADGLPRIFIQANHNLLFYKNIFLFDSEQRAELRKNGVTIPTDEEYLISDKYHACNYKKSDRLNLRYDTEDFFIRELADALRVLIRVVLYGEKAK